MSMNTETPAETPVDDLADFDAPSTVAQPAENEPVAAAPGQGSGDGGGSETNPDGAGNGEAAAALAPGPDASLEEELNPDTLSEVAGLSEGPMIPKGRFDEATGKLKDRLDTVQSELETFKAQQQAALAPLPKRDFAEERATIKQKFAAGDLDEDEYQDQREALILEEAEHKAHARLMLAQAEQQRVAAEQMWMSKFNAWADRNSEFMANEIRKDYAVMLVNRFSQDPSLTDEQVFEKAEKNLFEAFGWSANRAKGDSELPSQAPATPQNLHAVRDARDAAAQGRASVAPDPAAAGAGDRGRRAFPGVLDLKDKDFNALPKEVREDKNLAAF